MHRHQTSPLMQGNKTHIIGGGSENDGEEDDDGPLDDLVTAFILGRGKNVQIAPTKLDAALAVRWKSEEGADFSHFWHTMISTQAKERFLKAVVPALPSKPWQDYVGQVCMREIEREREKGGLDGLGVRFCTSVIFFLCFFFLRGKNQ